jgi:hypothetical protein
LSVPELKFNNESREWKAMGELRVKVEGSVNLKIANTL